MSGLPKILLLSRAYSFTRNCLWFNPSKVVISGGKIKRAVCFEYLSQTSNGAECQPYLFLLQREKLFLDRKSSAVSS